MFAYPIPRACHGMTLHVTPLAGKGPPSRGGSSASVPPRTSRFRPVLGVRQAVGMTVIDPAHQVLVVWHSWPACLSQPSEGQRVFDS